MKLKSSLYSYKPKPTDEIELILLPPKESKEISPEDIKFFYKNLLNILLDNDKNILC